MLLTISVLLGIAICVSCYELVVTQSSRVFFASVCMRITILGVMFIVKFEHWDKITALLLVASPTTVFAVLNSFMDLIRRKNESFSGSNFHYKLSSDSTQHNHEPPSLSQDKYRGSKL